MCVSIHALIFFLPSSTNPTSNCSFERSTLYRVPWLPNSSDSDDSDDGNGDDDNDDGIDYDDNNGEGDERMGKMMIRSKATATKNYIQPLHVEMHVSIYPID